MTVKRLTKDEFSDRFDYLSYVSGADLSGEMLKALMSDGNTVKVVETLRLIQKAAQECALYMEEVME